MEVWLTGRDLEDTITTVRTADEWSELKALVKKAASADDAAALQLLRGGASSSPPVKPEPGAAEAANQMKEAGRRAAGMVHRSQRAYGAMYDALPEDLVPQIAHLPQGCAYLLWQWIEAKFQSKESDNVSVLISEWAALRQDETETFDAYRARVNKMRDLLAAVDEKPSERVYAFTLLEKLQSLYRPAVLALHSGQQLKKTKTVAVPASSKEVLDIDWEEVTRLINAHERSEQRLGAEVQPGGEKAMSARTFGGAASSPSSGGRCAGVMVWCATAEMSRMEADFENSCKPGVAESALAVDAACGAREKIESKQHNSV
jgi:hypothetical protein